MTMTRREIQTLNAERTARVALDQARATLERALRELDSHTERFEASETLSDKAKVMNWALNELASGIIPNLRLDMFAQAQVELTRADMTE